MRREIGGVRLLANAGFVLLVLALAGWGATRVASRQWRVQRTFRVQTDFATASLKRLLATSTKLGELNVKLATDTVVPITTKVSTALEKVTRRAA